MFKKLITYTTALMIAVGSFAGASLAKDYSGQSFVPKVFCFSEQAINETVEAILLDRDKAFAVINTFPGVSSAQPGSEGCFLNDVGPMATVTAGDTVRVFKDEGWTVSVVKSAEKTADGTYGYWFVAEQLAGFSI